jgi:hypothetical protein
MNGATNADPLALVSARAFLHGVSDQVRLRFQGKNGRVGTRGKVHALVESDFFGESVLVPACRVGVSGWRLDRLKETTDEISCRRNACLHYEGDRAAGQVERQDDTLALFPLPTEVPIPA